MLGHDVLAALALEGKRDRAVVHQSEVVVHARPKQRLGCNLHRELDPQLKRTMSWKLAGCRGRTRMCTRPCPAVARVLATAHALVELNLEIGRAHV